MSQVITNAFEQYWQSCLAAEKPVVLDEFILADIPNLDITSPIDPETGLPPESQIVHRQNVDQRGRINNNAVAYTIVMDTTVGDFSFNAMYLRNKQNGVIGMIVYKGRETKLKTDQTTGQTGNSLVKSMLMGYDQAAEATLTHVDAGTWQIDYAARLRGMDEDIRQLQADLYGHHTFVGDGFKVVEKDGAYQVTQGVAIVGGLRVELKAPEVIHPGTKPIGVWVDVYRAGSLLSEHQNHFTIITSVADLTDHVDSNGYQHYVAKLATVQADGTIEDGRLTVEEGAGAIDSLRVELAQPGGMGLVGDMPKPITYKEYAGGAKGDGFNNDGLSEIEAHVAANGKAVLYPFGKWKGLASADNLHGSNFLNGLSGRYQAGMLENPIDDDPQPVTWNQKYSKTDYDGGWDCGAAYNSIVKVGGSSFGSAATSFAKYVDGEGDLIAHHARCELIGGESRGFALWAYTKIKNPKAKRACGAEITVNNSGSDVSWLSGNDSLDPSGIGMISAVNFGLADGLYGIHQGLRLPDRKADDKKRTWTGLCFGRNSIAPCDENGNGEAIRIRGSSYESGRYGGMTFGDMVNEHKFAYGIRMRYADFYSDSAIELRYGHKIQWGTSSGAAGKWAKYDEATNSLYLNGMFVSLNGSVVLKSRQTGVFQLTGTADGVTKNTESITLVELARYVKKVSDALFVHGMIGPT